MFALPETARVVPGVVEPRPMKPVLVSTTSRLVPIAKPAVEKEEVAVVEVTLIGPVELMEPPVMVKPDAEARPPLVLTERPPTNVEVELLVCWMLPPEMRRLPPVRVAPDADERPPFVEIEIPPVKEEVELLVCKMLPPVMVKPEAVESPPIDATESPPANVEVAVP